MKWRSRPLALCALAAIAIAAGACMSRDDADGPSRRVVRVTERDFTIHLPRRIAAGEVRFLVDNHGPDMHEMIVVRTSGAELPLRADAATVDEEALDPVTVGVLEPGQPRSVHEIDLTLQPGHYEVFCNMAGHYLAGMSTTFTVA